jgi:hypothetical protein
MGVLMIRCAKTGRAISTGKFVEPAALRSSPGIFWANLLSTLDATHEWFAKDAWVCDSESAQQSASLTSILSALRFNL